MIVKFTNFSYDNGGPPTDADVVVDARYTHTPPTEGDYYRMRLNVERRLDILGNTIKPVVVAVGCKEGKVRSAAICSYLSQYYSNLGDPHIWVQHGK